MRELTAKELDAVCGGAFQFGFLSKQIQQTQTNAAAVTQGFAVANVANVTQVNVALGSIL
jgi:hypothetical protein